MLCSHIFIDSDIYNSSIIENRLISLYLKPLML